jgi:hypothetical protein
MEFASYPVPVFIGLRLKVRRPRPRDWCNHSQTEHVTEIYSASNCIAGGPIIWYDSSALGVHWTVAESIAPWFQLDATSQAELIELGVLSPCECYTDDQLCLCAYRIFPLTFTNAASPSVLEARQLFVTEYALPLLEPDWTNFERLGYDVVQFKPIRLLDLDGARRAERHLTSPSYGCSPLSCNGLAVFYPVNRYCLLDDIDTAFQVGWKIGREEPEPGPYVIVEVLRRRE